MFYIVTLQSQLLAQDRSTMRFENWEMVENRATWKQISGVFAVFSCDRLGHPTGTLDPMSECIRLPLALDL